MLFVLLSLPMSCRVGSPGLLSPELEVLGSLEAESESSTTSFTSATQQFCQTCFAKIVETGYKPDNFRPTTAHGSLSTPAKRLAVEQCHCTPKRNGSEELTRNVHNLNPPANPSNLREIEFLSSRIKGEDRSISQIRQNAKTACISHL